MPVVINNELGEWARQVLKKNGVTSLRAAEGRTGIAYSTIKNLIDGRVVGEGSIMRFASSFGEDIVAALRLAGYHDLADLIEDILKGSPSHVKEQGVPGDGDAYAVWDHRSPSHVKEEREPYYADLEPELQYVMGLFKRILQSLPPGQMRDAYKERLRLTAEADLFLLTKRMELEEDREGSST